MNGIVIQIKMSEKKSRKKSKNPTAEIKLNCANANCNIDSEEFVTCFECKLIFHPECNGVDPNLYKLLNENKSPGLSWLWRCDTCIVPGDFLGRVSSSLDSVSDLILRKFNDLKETLDKSITEQINNKIEDLNKKLEKEIPTSSETTNPLQTGLPPKDSTSTADDAEDNNNLDNNLNTHKDTDQYMVKKSKPICKYYIKGICRHGSSGRKIVGGNECVFDHPRKCQKYCKFGHDITNGCSGPCNLFHPILCTNSINYKQCLRPECTFTHLVGTIRHRNPEQNINSRYSNFNNRKSPYSLNQYQNTMTRKWNNTRDYLENRNPIRQINDENIYQTSQNVYTNPKSNEDLKLLEFSSDIRQMKESIAGLHQLVTFTSKQRNEIEQTQNGHLHHINYNNNNSMQNQTSEQIIPKNFPPQNQFYPAQQPYQQ